MKGVIPVHFVVTVFVYGQNNSRGTVVGQMVPRIMVNGEVTVRNGLQQCNLVSYTCKE